MLHVIVAPVRALALSPRCATRRPAAEPHWRLPARQTLGCSISRSGDRCQAGRANSGHFSLQAVPLGSCPHSKRRPTHRVRSSAANEGVSDDLFTKPRQGIVVELSEDVGSYLMKKLLAVLALSSIIAVLQGFGCNLMLHPRAHTLAGPACGFYLVIIASQSYALYWEGKGNLGKCHVLCFELYLRARSYFRGPGADKACANIQKLCSGSFHALTLGLKCLAEDLPINVASLRQYYNDEQLKALEERARNPREFISAGADFVRQALVAEGLDNGLVADKTYMLEIMQLATEYQLALQSVIKIASGGLPPILIYVGTWLCNLLIFTLPFVLYESHGLMLPLVMMPIAFAYFGLLCICKEIGNPFGTEPSDFFATDSWPSLHNRTLAMLAQKAPA